VIFDFGGWVVFGYDGGPAGAAGLRFSGFLWWWGTVWSGWLWDGGDLGEDRDDGLGPGPCP